jgi:hypothetical protein
MKIIQLDYVHPPCTPLRGVIRYAFDARMAKLKAERITGKPGNAETRSRGQGDRLSCGTLGAVLLGATRECYILSIGK